MLAVLSLSGCARHALTDLNRDDDGDPPRKGPVLTADAGSGNDASPPAPQPGDGDGEGPPEEDGGTSEPEPESDAGNDRKPSPNNVAGCPSTAPHDNDVAVCAKDLAIMCLYGTDYLCTCLGVFWKCD